MGFATFSPVGSGGLRFDNYFSSELLADPSADSSRVPQVRLGVKELCEKAGAQNASVNYSLRGEAVFSRFVRLPRLDSTKVRQIVEFEARQNVPFPLEEVYWDYQLVSRSESSEVEVVLVAIKRDLLDELNEAVEDTGMTTEIVDIAPMALLNAFRFNYGDISDCSLLVDIGARTTNLVFIQPGLVFSRSVRTGGNNVTSAVAKEFNEPFQAAEERKRRDGFVNLGGAYEDPDDPEVASLSKVIRNSMTKLHAEISRSIGFYRAQQKGDRPSRIYLAGAGSSLPYMSEFFAEKFQVPVELFNPLRNVKLGKDMENHEVLQHAHTIGELVGLALRDTGPCPMEINLQPSVVTRRKEQGSRRPFFVMAALCLILALVGWWLYLQHAETIAAEKLADLKPKTQAMGELENQIEDAQEKTEALQNYAQPLLNVSVEREFWTGLLETLNENMPAKRIWITELIPVADEDQLQVQNLDSVSELIEEWRRPRRGGPKEAEEDNPPPAVNAIRIHGIVLDQENNGGRDPRQVVISFVENLMDSDYFDIQDKDGTELYVQTPSPEPDRYGQVYILELPLKKTLPLE